MELSFFFLLCAIFEQRYFFLGVKMLSLSPSIRANLLRGFLNILNLYQHDDTLCVCVCVSVYLPFPSILLCHCLFMVVNAYMKWITSAYHFVIIAKFKIQYYL